MTQIDVVEFESSSVELQAGLRSDKPLTVGWFGRNFDVLSASTRYRKFYAGLGLESIGGESHYYTELAKILEDLPRLDAVVIVKRLDSKIPGLVSAAVGLRKPVFLDLCDDIVSDHYGVDLSEEILIPMIFNGIARFIDGIVVPCMPMKQRMEDYCRREKLDVPVHVVPDGIETATLFSHICNYVEERCGATKVRISLPLDKLKPTKNNERKQVIWFGNYGSMHSNFGIVSIFKAAAALEKVNKDIPLELVVVSNSRASFDTMIKPLNFPSRYVEWSPLSAAQELLSADVALLTTGDDEFCKIKSNNRALQALAAGVPVVTDPSDALGPVADCAIVGNYEHGLRHYLGVDGKQAVERSLAKFELARREYELEALGDAWTSVIKETVTRKDMILPAAPYRRIFIFLESGAWEPLPALIRKCRESNVDFRVCLTNSRKLVHILKVLAEHGVTPSIVKEGDEKSITANTLRGYDELLLDTTSGTFSKLFIAQANILGIPSTKKIWKYKLDAISYKPSNPGPYDEWLPDTGPVKWAFVTNPDTKGWILNAICREIGSRQPDSWLVAYSPTRLPPAENFFFAHQNIYMRYWLESRDKVILSRCFIWYTHPSDKAPENIPQMLQAFNDAAQVIFACSSNLDLWLSRGLPKSKGIVVLGGADPDLFRARVRGGGVVGVSSSYYERKNPELLHAIVKAMPHRKFVLLGKGWESYSEFADLVAQPNFTYKTLSYRQYPDEYAKWDVFLSTSKLEGGPIPLLEAMMANVVPVASDTGFAKDLIVDRINGYLFNVEADANTVVPMIEAAFDSKADVRATVLRYSWDRFSQNIIAMGS